MSSRGRLMVDLAKQSINIEERPSRTSVENDVIPQSSVECNNILLVESNQYFKSLPELPEQFSTTSLIIGENDADEREEGEATLSPNVNVDPDETTDEENKVPSLGNTEDVTEEEPFQSSGSEYVPSEPETSNSDEPGAQAAELSAADGRTKKRRNKGQGDPSQWKRQKNATARLHGQEYVGFKKDITARYHQNINKQPRQVMPRCQGHSVTSKGPKQKFECSAITDDDRVSIFSHFWRLNSWEAKRVYVSTLVSHAEPNHRRNTTQPEESRKQVGFKYYLQLSNGNEKIRRHVCKKMFLATLAVGEKAVRKWTLANESVIQTPTLEEDNSTKSECQKAVREFLEKLPKVESHYCRASSRKLYLEPIWNSYRHVHSVFLDSCKAEGKRACSWRTFMKTFKAMNLEIYTPKKHQCNTCMMHKHGTFDDFRYEQHIARKNLAREEKNKDKESTNSSPEKICAYTVDLQAVLLCPRLGATAVYFKTKLKVHNLTFFNLNDKDVSCFVWTESNGGLESDVFASIMIRFLTSEIQKHKPSKIIVWSDGCTYQNRNIKLSNALLQLAMEQTVVIEQKYLEVGHTQMEADSIHSTIERKLGRSQEICIPADYLRIIKSAREKPSPYNVTSLTYRDFYKYDAGIYASIRPGIKSGGPCVTDICALQYLPEGIIQYKLKFTDMWENLPRRPSKNLYNAQHPPLYDSPCAIELTKFLHLQELKLLMNADYHPFYNTLNHKGCDSFQDCPHLRLVPDENQG